VLTKTVVVLHRNAPPTPEINTYATFEIKALPYVKVSNGTRTLVNASPEENFIQDVIVYVYKWDGAYSTPEAMCYIPNVNDVSASVSILLKSGSKKVYVAANTGGGNSIVYNNGNTASMPNGESFSTTFNALNNVLVSTSSGFNAVPSINLSAGSEGGSEGLIKTMAGGAFGTSNGLINNTTPYNSNTRFFMSNIDGPDIETAGGTIPGNNTFMIYPDVPLESSKSSSIGSDNHYDIGLQRGIAKVSFRISANGATDYAGPYYSSPPDYSPQPDGAKGRFTPWEVNGKAVWSLGGINKHMYPFQLFAGQYRVVASPNYWLSPFRFADDTPIDEWYASYDNTRVIGTGKKYGTSSFDFSDVKNAMLSPDNYTPVSSAGGGTLSYAYSTENGTQFPQVKEQSTYVMIGGEYRPENWISDVKRNDVTASSPYIGWNGANAISGTDNTFATTYSEPSWSVDEELYFLYSKRVFIHGKKNLYAYFAWELGIASGIDENSLLSSALITSKVEEWKSRGSLVSYYRGQCLYRVYISDSSLSKMDEGWIGVRRNFIYDVNLDIITGPGDSTLDMLEPTVCGSCMQD